MYKTIIIDDEPLARVIIRDYLSGDSRFEIVAECENGFEGIKAIGRLQPDLVFLDIQMPKITGFEMLELLDRPIPVIFTTAFDAYAIRAFETNAVDYLLKPFSRERFEKALEKWHAKTGDQTGTSADVRDLASDYPGHRQRMVVKSGHEIRILPFDEILYVEAYDDYIKVHIKNDCYLKKQTMQSALQQLGETGFARVHRSYIVNLAAITRIEPAAREQYVAVLRDNTRVPLSRSGYARLKELLGI